MSKNHLVKQARHQQAKNNFKTSIAGTVGQLDLKWRCLQAWCLSELQTAEEMVQKGKGQKVFNEELEKEIKKVLIEVADEIKTNGNTKHILKILSQRNPRISFYYNEISKVVDRYFKINEEWIASFFVLNVLSEYKIRGHKGFESFDLLGLLAEFEKSVEKDLKLKHFKCAVDLIESMDRVKFSFKKGKTK